MNVFVVIQFKDLTGCRYRLAALEYVTGYYEELAGRFDARLVIGGCDPFTRARALNELIRPLPADAVIIQSDPDSFLADPADYLRALRLAVEKPGIVVPHSRYLYLDEARTREVLDVGPLPFGATKAMRFGVDECDEVGPCGYGNTVVFTRETWERAGCYDERFPVWGGDDAAFAMASDAFLSETRRLAGDVIHLWHPRLDASIPGTKGYAEQFEILAQYRDAKAVGRVAVRALVEARGRYD